MKGVRYYPVYRGLGREFDQNQYSVYRPHSQKLSLKKPSHYVLRTNEYLRKAINQPFFQPGDIVYVICQSPPDWRLSIQQARIISKYQYFKNAITYRVAGIKNQLFIDSNGVLDQEDAGLFKTPKAAQLVLNKITRVNP
jgi:hypothetical protein